MPTQEPHDTVNPHAMGRAGLWAVGLGASIMPLDFAVNIAFPAITASFALPTQDIRWMALCYVFTYGALMLVFGALGDRIGHLRVFTAGLWLAFFSLLTSALAPSYALLLASRVVQGVAVALTLSCAPALVLQLHAAEARTRALSSYGVMHALAGMLAPLLGGLSMLALGWAGVFWMRLPVVLVAIALLPRLRRQLAQAVSVTPPVSRPGLLGLFADARRSQGGFVWLQASNAVVQFTAFTVPLCLPYFLMRAHGLDTLASGASLSWWALGVLAGSAWLERLARRVPMARLLQISGVAVGLTLALMAGAVALPVGQGAWGLAVALACQGVALGMFQVAYSDRVVQGLPPSARGVAGSLTIVTRTLGVMAGAWVWLWMLSTGADAWWTFAALYAVAAVISTSFFAVTARVLRD